MGQVCHLDIVPRLSLLPVSLVESCSRRALKADNTYWSRAFRFLQFFIVRLQS